MPRHLIMRSPVGQRSDIYQLKSIKIYLIDEKMVGVFKQLIKAHKFIRKNKVKIIHSHRYKENILSCIVKLFLPNECRLIKTQHGSFDITTTRRMKVYRVVDLIFTKYFFYKVVSVSFNILCEFKKFLPIHKIVIIHNSIQPEKYKPLCNNKDFSKIF